MEKKPNYGDIQKKLVLDIGGLLDRENMDQSELAEMTGISPQSISNMVRGSSQVRLNSLTKICLALNLEPGDLIVWQQVVPSPIEDGTIKDVMKHERK